jgi:hypothetical protein
MLDLQRTATTMDGAHYRAPTTGLTPVVGAFLTERKPSQLPTRLVR